jgi:hypothetical protein
MGAREGGNGVPNEASNGGVGVEVGVGMSVSVGVALGTAVIVGVFVAAKVAVGLDVSVEVGVATNLGENTEQAVCSDSRTNARSIWCRVGLFIAFKSSVSNNHSIGLNRSQVA